jgi:3-methyladenine DNA glycosylase AlkC
MKTILLFTVAVCGFAQQPRIQNAKLETRTATPTLDAALRTILSAQSEPAWIGYSIPRAQRRDDWYDDSSRGCILEDGHNTTVIRDINTAVPLEGPANMILLFRVSEQKVQRIRMLAPDCLLDAGGLPFYWFNNVKASDSVAFLEGLTKERVGSAVYAIAMTRDPSSDAAMNRLVDPSQPDNIRRSAVSWLATPALERLLTSDPSDPVREQAVSVLARRKDPGAIQTVIQAAKADKSAKVRRQAVNALARSKDPAAVRFFEDVFR